MPLFCFKVPELILKFIIVHLTVMELKNTAFATFSPKALLHFHLNGSMKVTFMGANADTSVMRVSVNSCKDSSALLGVTKGFL